VSIVLKTESYDSANLGFHLGTWTQRISRIIRIRSDKFWISQISSGPQRNLSEIRLTYPKYLKKGYQSRISTDILWIKKKGYQSKISIDIL
jgi:hypothetical protein